MAIQIDSANGTANIAVNNAGSVTINTGTDSAPGAAVTFTAEGQMLVNGAPASSGPVSVANDGAVIIQTGNDSTGPLEPFILEGDGKINGVDLVALKSQVNALAATPAGETDSGWVNASLIGNWVNYGNTQVQNMAPASFRKIGKRVHLRGLVKNTGAVSPNPVTANIFKLPTGFYPQRQLQFIVPSQDKAVSLKVQTDGWVYVLGADPNWVGLDSVSFLVD